MYLLIIVLMLIASVLMCGIVLIQNSKGGGLASGFSSSNSFAGVRKTTDFLEKATWSLAGFMVVCSILSAYSLPSGNTSSHDAIMENAQQNAATNPYNMPVGSTAPQTGDETPAEAPAAETPANNN